MSSSRYTVGFEVTAGVAAVCAAAAAARASASARTR